MAASTTRAVCALALAGLGLGGCWLNAGERPAGKRVGGEGATGGGEAAGGAWADWPMPNPPSAALLNPHDYDTGTPGVVVDKVTGLVWQRVVDADGLLWPAARAHCAALSLGGRHGWRLPTLIEMVSLVDFTRSNPAIDVTAFPDTPGGPYWTSTPFGGSTSESWYVAFATGFNYHGHNDLLAIRARCVTGAVPARPDPGGAGGTGARYAFPDAETVLDTRTRLTWQRTVTTTATWDDAGRACQVPARAGAGWRLASMKELQTLLDVHRSEPAIDAAAFPATPLDQYWTSSALAGSSTDAWIVSFWLGISGTISRGSLGWVRCVR